MTRIDVIQSIVSRKKARNYLEIGFGNGDCFFSIKAPHKIAVDPKFFHSRKQKYKYYLRNRGKIFREFCQGINKYHEITSDDFFKKRSQVLVKYPPDVVFVDGLHSHEQSLKDVLNVLRFLKEDSVVIMHDCSPHSEAEAFPATSYEKARRLNLPGWIGRWCGDVWKTIPYLRSARKDLNIFVLECDMGLGVITKGKPESVLNYSVEDVRKLSYKDLDKDRERILNLKAPEYIEEFIRSCR